MKCPKCDAVIPADRVDIIQSIGLPLVCVDCSQVQAPVVLMSYEHKTGGAPMVIPNNPDGTHNEELIRKATRCYNRSR